jgi:putative hydrolase of the HAD superfamily
MIKAVLCDLDDTLYDEATYVASGLRAVARHLAAQYAADADTLFRVMQTDIAHNGRGTAFNEALRAIGQPDGQRDVDALVNIYRQHQPAISLYLDAALFLNELSQAHPDCKTALVTDGLPLMQQNKVAALGIADRFNAVVYCWELNAPKPNPAGLKEAIERLDVLPQECLMIGDRIDHDMQPAKALGMTTIRLLRGRFKNDGLASDTVDRSFHDFAPVLDYLEQLR